MKKFIQEHPIISNLVLMLLIFTCLITVVYFAMDWGTRHSARRTVPNFVGLVIGDAKHFADRRDLEIIANDSLYVPSYPGGVVLDQHPLEGAVVKPGRKVYVTISSINQRKAVVPFVANRTLRQAVHLLETAGFGIEKIHYVRDMAHNYVIAEFVNGEAIVEGSTLQANVGSGVVLRVGFSPKSAISMPQLQGLTLFEAKHKIWENGLNVGEVSFDPGIPALERDNAKVYYQSVRANKGVGYGESVSIRLALENGVAKTPAAEAAAPAAEPKVSVATETPAKEEVKAESKTESKAEPQPEAKAEETKSVNSRALFKKTN